MTGWREVSGYELYVHTEFIQDSNIEDASKIILASNDTSRFIEGLPLETEHHVVIRAYDNHPNYSAFLPMFQPTPRVFLLGPLPTLPLSVSVFQK